MIEPFMHASTEENIAFLEDVEYSKYVDCVKDNYEEKQYISDYCHDIEKGSKNPGR